MADVSNVNNAKPWIAYYRVSTDKQGMAGLGMEAQRNAVNGFIAGRGELVGEFVEVESGKRHRNRPQLLAALDECRKRRAILIIAKLDRLARNVAFIANLMESNVEFIAADMPEANRLTIHILAAVAEHEARIISDRTKAALAVAKGRGTKLGNPRYGESIAAQTPRSCHRGQPVSSLKPPAPVQSPVVWSDPGRTIHTDECAYRLRESTLASRRAVAESARPVPKESAGASAY